jgi:hypothetical protein
MMQDQRKTCMKTMGGMKGMPGGGADVIKIFK